MTKVINVFLSYIKILLLLVCFVFSFFIILNMYRRLEKNVVASIFNFIPYLLLFILFSINVIFRQKSVTDNLFYNITCCFVFIMILFAVYRTFFDKNMVIMMRLGYNMNFNYFADIIAPMRAMLYILCVSNVLLMFEDFSFRKKKNSYVPDNSKKKVKGARIEFKESLVEDDTEVLS